MIFPTPTQIERFWSNVDRSCVSGCWPWMGQKDNKGGRRSVQYGRFTFSVGGLSRKVAAHRLAYLVAKGAIPEGLLIRHTCDNGICVNPDHLITGTNWDNHLDAVERGRLCRGSRVRTAKLDEPEVIEIKRGLVAGGLFRELADQYNVHLTTIRQIAIGAAWRHVSVPEFEPKPCWRARGEKVWRNRRRTNLLEEALK